MHLQENTILITGGSSGIGLELACRLQEKGNTVIVCGRSREKLEKAEARNPHLIPYACDISNEVDCIAMVNWIEAQYPSLNMLINNAAIVHATSFMDDDGMLKKAAAEIDTNLMGPIRLAKLFYPLLLRQASGLLINVTTGLIYAPRAAYPIYNATKAALHAFTQVLRIQLADAPVRIVEVQFPAVDTPWHLGNPPPIAIPVEDAVTQMLDGLAKGREEIRVGGVKLLYGLSRVAPAFALRKINQL
ncbi:MAG: SDR family NAD(P)-dependent oxidoreductase [Bacteroidota bacterium]